MNDTARLAMIRARLAAIAPGQWSRVHDGDGCFVEARGPMGELSPVLRFNPGASDDEIMLVVDLPETLVFLLGLVDRAIARLKPPVRQDVQRGEAQARDPKNFAAECGMKCQDPSFKVFLEERHGLERPLTDERVAQKVRGLMGVTSRRELNDGGRASEAWRQLRGEFDAWLRAGR
ncbi:hypothetical protein ASD64_09020 [Mesorhizobium sp. Root157]|uniref:hypothetical protein n=1 Tax=Mesorhizobium sp. Root157 TaxID=1736477 RepID=UPI0006F80DCE|nr:hypothetical protein [Mesorhizobium sp. Root157]KQZ81887.1 hypothetical protein ASD64_09020 [Mesorhizobium sp. Root157]